MAHQESKQVTEARNYLNKYIDSKEEESRERARRNRYMELTIENSFAFIDTNCIGAIMALRSGENEKVEQALRDISDMSRVLQRAVKQS